MSLKKCKECGIMVSSEAKICPHCGVKLRKSKWLKFGVSILIMVACLFILHFPHESTSEKKQTIEDTVKVGLTEKAGLPCISVTLTEKSKNNFVGDAKLEDGRELDITATPEGDYIRYTYTFKQGYEYKCKHHIDQIKLGFSAAETERVLRGKVWNDESYPIRGFVVIEFIGKNGYAYHTVRDFVHLEDRETNWNRPVSFDWIPPGKDYNFLYRGESTLFNSMDSIRVEFFNLGNKELGFVNLSDRSFDSFNLQLLQAVDVKLTTGKIPVADIKYEVEYEVEDFSEATEYAKEYLEVAKTGTGIRQAQSMFNLGVLYETGQGVEKNFAQAIYWYKESAKHGYKSAQEKLVELGVAYPPAAENETLK